MDLKSFGRKMRVTGRVVADNADKLVRAVAVAVDGTVVLGTPVDTGRARTNWQAELDKPATGTVQTAGAGAAQASIDKAGKVIEQYNGDTHKEIHITNNLPYIGRLNDGWSAQAPAGFVEEAVHIGAAQIKGAKLTIEGGVR